MAFDLLTNSLILLFWSDWNLLFVCDVPNLLYCWKSQPKEEKSLRKCIPVCDEREFALGHARTKAKVFLAFCLNACIVNKSIKPRFTSLLCVINISLRLLRTRSDGIIKEAELWRWISVRQGVVFDGFGESSCSFKVKICESLRQLFAWVSFHGYVELEMYWITDFHSTWFLKIGNFLRWKIDTSNAPEKLLFKKTLQVN